MHVDISRASFDPDKHFSSVIALQGRVMLDADIREQGAILLHQLRTTVKDLLGPAARPKGAEGFTIGKDGNDLTVTAGRMYVDGILVENPEPCTYLGQPDGYLDQTRDSLTGNSAYAVYLRVWERAVTALQDPSIREVALGAPGPDTAARSQVVWQIGVLPLAADDDPVEKLTTLHEFRSMLAARVDRRSDAGTEACTVPPTSRFRGPENQLYRVEIHNGGRVSETPPPTFVWSRDNGSVEFAVLHRSGTEVALADLGRDGKQTLEVGDWVELLDDAVTARAADEIQPDPPRRLFEVRAVDVPRRTVTLDADPSAANDPLQPGHDPQRHPLLRRWDHRPAKGTDAAHGLPLVEGQWLTLEDGVEVRFSAPSGGDGPNRYRRGDHWLIPARTVTGDVVWPEDEGEPLAVAPHGTEYHYAPLAHVKTDGTVPPLGTTFAVAHR